MKRVPIDRLPIIDGDVARLPLTQGQVAVIDAADVELVAGACWHAQYVPSMHAYYAVRNGSKLPHTNEPRSVFLHRLIAGAPSDLKVDHANHDTLDNRRANLRVCTHRDNLRNRQTVRGSSGYSGVYLVRGNRRRPWESKVQVDGSSHHLGYYSTAVQAALARDAYLRECHPSEFWTFNFPRPNERGIHRPQGATA